MKKIHKALSVFTADPIQAMQDLKVLHRLLKQKHKLSKW